jgi:hypothetical protein
VCVCVCVCERSIAVDQYQLVCRHVYGRKVPRRVAVAHLPKQPEDCAIYKAVSSLSTMEAWSPTKLAGRSAHVVIVRASAPATSLALLMGECREVHVSRRSICLLPLSLAPASLTHASSPRFLSPKNVLGTPLDTPLLGGTSTHRSRGSSGSHSNTRGSARFFSTLAPRHHTLDVRVKLGRKYLRA